MTGKNVSNSALSQRRALLPQSLFDHLMASALKPKANIKSHPQAFYHHLRLCGLDGTQFSISNTPQVKKQMRKARTRRGKAAFPKIGAVVMVELGLHNPLAAAMGGHGESEMELAQKVIHLQPQKSLNIMDRYYGVPSVLVNMPCEEEREFLARVKNNLKRRVLEIYPDGSALVEIRSGDKSRLVREIVGLVQRSGRSKGTRVRLWTSLLDWRKYKASEVLALYAHRWEEEIFYKELKVDMRSTPLLQSHTPLTAMQEITALILAYAVLVDVRMKAARKGEVGVLRISFLKTFHAVQGLWEFLEITADMLTPEQAKLVVRRKLQELAEFAITHRRHRSCQRALRQPVSSWPRLRKNTVNNGAVNYAVNKILS